MPRVAQTLDSNEKTQGEEGGEDDDMANIDIQSNRNNLSDNSIEEGFEIVVGNAANEMPRIPDSSQNSSTRNPFDEDEEDEENSPLRVVIDGIVKKFKKDSRVWLHKSSAKIKRLTRTAAIADDKISNLDVQGDQQIRIKVDEEMEIGQVGDNGNISSAEKDVEPEEEMHSEIVNLSESNLSIVGDSDADLSYSEDECDQPTCKRSFSFYQQETGVCRVQSRTAEMMEVDDVSSEIQTHDKETTTPISVAEISYDESSCKCCQKNIFSTIYNQSTEHDMSVKRLAPAIAQEDESLKESLLDYAVNHFGKHQQGSKKILSGRIFKRAKRKACSARRKEGNSSGNRLPTGRSLSLRITRQRQDQLTGRGQCLTHFNRYLPSFSSIQSDESCETMVYTPPLDRTLISAPRQVPSLLILAASALNLGTIREKVAAGNEEQEETPHNTM